MNKNQSNAAQAMKTAWEKARQYATENGGKPSQYFIYALREAWTEIKNQTNQNDFTVLFLGA